MVVRKSDKALEFLMGLRDDICVQLMYQGVWTYNAMDATTYWIEQVNI